MNYFPLDRDFIRTEEDLFFCIIGYVHPPQRVLSYLKYIPADTGKWKLKNHSLERVLPYYSARAVLNTFEFLRTNYPQYIFYDEQSDLEFSAVPYYLIKEYYSSHDKLGEIFKLTNLDPLVSKLKSFLLELSELSDVSIETFGVTGSILLDIHNPNFSDLDVTVFGYENSLKVKQIINNIFEESHPKISRLDLDEAERWQNDKVKRFNISPNDARLLFSRKWNMGIYDNTRFSIHPIKNPEEIFERYGDKSFVEKGEIILHAKVVDNSEAIYLPSKYEISDVNILEGEKVENIKEIISYEGLFDAVAEKGELVKASGQLELVSDKSKGISYYRVVIGSRKGNSKEFLSLLT